MTAAFGTHSVKALPEKSVGQYRAMRHGMRGKFGIFGNVESVTYRAIKGVLGSNPTLTAERWL